MSSFTVDSENKGISNRIFNADSFSLLTSIGIHLLILGGLLPSLWQISSEAHSNDRRTVNILELNPIERSRLPNLSPTPEVPAVPSIPTPDPAIPNWSSLSPASPPSVPSLPSLPSLPPLPSISAAPSYPPSVGIYSPPVPSVRIPQNRLNFPPAPSYLPPAPPNNPNLEVAEPRPIARPQFDPFRDTLSREGILRAPIDASREEQLRNQQQRGIPPETVPQNPSAIATLPNQAAIAAERRRRLLDDVLEGSASLQQDPSNTSSEEVRKNYLTWIDKAPRGQLDIINVTGIYPKTACSRKIEGTSVYGVSVNPQGIITGTPYLIKSAGYPLLNQKASLMVRGLNFENTSNQMKSYQVNVRYQYDPSICPTDRQPSDQNPPVETRVTPPQTPTLEPPRPTVTPNPQNQSPSPAIAPQTPANPQPVNDRPGTPATPQPEVRVEPQVIPPIPTQPSQDNLINVPSGNPKPENLIPQTPDNPPESKKTEQPVEPPAPPATQKPEVSPPSPPTSKKPEPPLAESRQLNN